MQQAQEKTVPLQGRRLQLSLPTGFSFNYRENGPRTPEPRENDQEQLLEPPQPPKVRIRRRKPFPTEPIAVENEPSQLPLPTINFPDSDFRSTLSLEPKELLEGGLLAPITGTSRSAKRYGRIISPPKTPLDQIFNSFDAAFGASQPIAATPHQSFDTVIPDSPSRFSDSEDSDSSSDSGPSWEDDFGSPDTETIDPFAHIKGESSGLSSPMTFVNSQQSSYRSSRQYGAAKQYEKTKWTPEMDDHLWKTYMAYLADPTVTPFKMLPGIAPPLGVCHRVARDAKKHWKGLSRSSPSPMEAESTDYMSVDREPSTLPADFQQSFLMPRPHVLRSQSSKTFGKWPRSDSSTRRRLRQLCKRKPTLAAHYNRMMQTRTPSPFEGSSSSEKAGSSSRFESPPRSDLDAFNTRDLNITLATSTAPSMQPDGPLVQLAHDGGLKPRPYSTEYIRPSARAGAHHRSQSLQFGLGLNKSQSIDPSVFRQLASPFHEPEAQVSDWKPSLPTTLPPQPARMESVREEVNDEGVPVKIHAPRPLSGSMKRRAEYPLGEEDMTSNNKDPEKRRSMIQNLFRTSIDEGDARLPQQSNHRGFSLPAGKSSRQSWNHRNLADIFTPPQTILEQTENLPSVTPQEPIADQMNTYRLNPPPHLSLSRPNSITRLGSPFAPAANARASRTFPRSAFPAGLNSPAFSAMEQTQPRQQQPYSSHLRQQQTMSWDGTQSPHTRFI
jgi:hypothetical protein